MAIPRWQPYVVSPTYIKEAPSLFFYLSVEENLLLSWEHSFVAEESNLSSPEKLRKHEFETQFDNSNDNNKIANIF